MSTDMAIGMAKSFLRSMAQPFDQASQVGHALWTIEDVERRQAATQRARPVITNEPSM